MYIHVYMFLHTNLAWFCLQSVCCYCQVGWRWQWGVPHFSLESAFPYIKQSCCGRPSFSAISRHTQMGVIHCQLPVVDGQITMFHHGQSGWWLSQPLRKIFVNWDDYSQWENKKCSKSPTSNCWIAILLQNPNRDNPNHWLTTGSPSLLITFHPLSQITK